MILLVSLALVGCSTVCAHVSLLIVTPRDRCQFGPTRARQTDAERTEFPLSAQGSSHVQIQTRNALAETYTNGLREGKQ